MKVGKQPDVIHIHNWETAIVGPLFWDVFVNQVGTEQLPFPSALISRSHALLRVIVQALLLLFLN